MARTKISDRELQVIKDREFLKIKASALLKIDLLLSETQIALKSVLDAYELPFPNKSCFNSSKISKGENYLGFPYRVLDFPAFFSKENIFAFRTMFWWGNFFSVTIHLEGASLEYYRKKIIDKIDILEGKQIYVSVGDSPWQYHYESDNYILLDRDAVAMIENHSFLKLSKKIKPDEWENLPSFSADFLTQMLSLLCD